MPSRTIYGLIAYLCQIAERTSSDPFDSCNSTTKEGHAQQARVIYDKFHILKHQGVAMGKVRKQE
jgi:Transposase